MTTTTDNTFGNNKSKENGQHRNGDGEERREMANQLVLMGFSDRETNRQALIATKYVLADAIAWLFEKNRSSVAMMASEKEKQQERKRRTLPTAESSSHIFGARSSGMDYFATSKSPSMALLPKWLIKLLVNPGFRRFASSKRYTIDSSCDAATGILELAEQWEKLSDQSRSHYETMWPDALQCQVTQIRKRFHDIQYTASRVSRNRRRRLNNKDAPQNWPQTMLRKEKWNSDQHFDQFYICEMPEDPRYEDVRKVDFPRFWQQCENLFFTLEPNRIVSSVPGSRDEQRRELLEDEKILGVLFETIDPRLKQKYSKTTTTTTTNTKKNTIEGEAQSAVKKLSNKLNIMLNQQMEKNALLRKRLKSKCLDWANQSSIDEKEILEIKSRWSQCKSWAITSDCLCRGVVPKTLNFNSYRPEKLPPSWRIAVRGRPEAHNVNQAMKHPHQKKDLQVQLQEQVDDTICGICFDGESTEKNPIVFCETCDLPLHQSCYGIKDIPEGDYFCDRCLYIERQMIGSSVRVDPECSCCPVKKGAMKITEEGTWIHVMCALWYHDHVKIKNKMLMKSICITSSTSSFGCCSVCKMNSGLTIKCSRRQCKKYFHPICAWYGGLEMRISRIGSRKYKKQDEEERIRDGLCYVAYCSECSECDVVLQQQIRMKYCNEILHSGLEKFLAKRPSSSSSSSGYSSSKRKRS